MGNIMKYKLLFCDLDETLLIGQNVPEFNKKAIEKLKTGQFIVCSGRPYETAYPIFKQLGTLDKSGEYSILLNGGLIIENKDRRIIRAKGLDFKDVEALFEYARYLDVCVMAFSVDNIYMFHASQEEIDRKIEQKAKFKIIDDYCIDCLKDEVIIKMIYQKCDMDYLMKIKEEMKDITGNLQVSFSSYRYLEFNHRDVCKGEAMLFLSSYLGIKQEEVIAVGDNYNDSTMLEAAGLGVCVGDGIVKDCADYICERGYKEGAVKEVIEKFMIKGEDYEF